MIGHVKKAFVATSRSNRLNNDIVIVLQRYLGDDGGGHDAGALETSDKK